LGEQLWQVACFRLSASKDLVNCRVGNEDRAREGVAHTLLGLFASIVPHVGKLG